MSETTQQSGETQAPADDADPIAVTIAAWVQDRIYDSPVSRSTEAFNHIVDVAVPDLVRRLKEIA